MKELTNEFAVAFVGTETTANAVSEIYRIARASYIVVQVAMNSPVTNITLEGSMDYRADNNTGTWTTIGSAITTSGFTVVPTGIRNLRVKRDATTNPAARVLVSATIEDAN